MNASDQSSSQALQVGDRGKSVFASVLVGIDGSPEALEAARQASVLAEGRVELLAAYDIAAGLVGGIGLSAPAYTTMSSSACGPRRISRRRAGTWSGSRTPGDGSFAAQRGTSCSTRSSVRGTHS